MKKSFILFLLSLLFCACNYELDPYDLQPWKDQMSMYMGTSVYNPGDSISFLHNEEQCQFAIRDVNESLFRKHDHSLFPSHKKQPINGAFLRLQIGNEEKGNVFELEVFKVYEEDFDPLGMRISLYGNDNSSVELNSIVNDMDFSNDTLTLNNKCGHSVTLVRHIGITEIKFADGDIWKLERTNM